MKRFCRTLDKTVFFGTLSFQNTIQFVLCLKTHFEKIGNATSARVQNAHNIQNMYIYIYIYDIYTSTIICSTNLGTWNSRYVWRFFCAFDEFPCVLSIYARLRFQMSHPTLPNTPNSPLHHSSSSCWLDRRSPAMSGLPVFFQRVTSLLYFIKARVKVRWHVVSEWVLRLIRAVRPTKSSSCQQQKPCTECCRVQSADLE